MSDDEKIPVRMSPSDNELAPLDLLPKRRGLDVELINAPIRAVQPHLAVGLRFDAFRNEVGPPLHLPPRMVSGHLVHEQALSTRSNAAMLIGMKTAREFLRSVFRGEYRATSEQASKMIGVLQGLLTKSKEPDRKVLNLAAATSLFDPEMDAALVGINACEPVPSDVHVIALACQSLLRKQVFELTNAELVDECRRIHKLIDRRASAYYMFICELAHEDWRLFSQDREEWFSRHKANGFRLAPFFDDWSVNCGNRYPELEHTFLIEQRTRTEILEELADRHQSGKPVEMPPVSELELWYRREREAFHNARDEQSRREREERERRQREEREREEREREEHKQAIERQVRKREVERRNREYLDKYWADCWAEQRDEDERFERFFEKTKTERSN